MWVCWKETEMAMMTEMNWAHLTVKLKGLSLVGLMDYWMAIQMVLMKEKHLVLEMV